jgi:hypothetical protein
MKVKELIRELEALDQDAEVHIYDSEGGQYFPVTNAQAIPPRWEDPTGVEIS